MRIPLLRLPFWPILVIEIRPILVGAYGYVPTFLFKYMEDLGLEKKEAKKHISKDAGNCE